MPKSKLGKFIDKILDANSFLPILCIIGIIIGILICYNVADTKPATDKDYEPLLKIQSELIEDFDNVYNYPIANVFISDTNIKVTVENEQCSIKMTFDKNQKYLYSEFKDKVITVGILIIGLVSFSIGGICGLVFISLVLLFILQTFCEWIYEVRNKNKKQHTLYDNISHDVNIDH